MLMKIRQNWIGTRLAVYAEIAGEDHCPAGCGNFFMIGQWVMPGGGVTSALLMGRDITRIIRSRDRKKFQVA